MSGDRRPAILGSIALAGAISDFFDGRVARRMNSADGFGQWLDSLADIVFVLTALACEAHAGAVPVYIPTLIAVSFTQYVIDSLMICGPSTPVKSRLGHWGGVINFGLVIHPRVIATPDPRAARRAPRDEPPVYVLPRGMTATARTGSQAASASTSQLTPKALPRFRSRRTLPGMPDTLARAPGQCPETIHPAMSRRRRASVGACAARYSLRAALVSQSVPIEAASQQR